MNKNHTKIRQSIHKNRRLITLMVGDPTYIGLKTINYTILYFLSLYVQSPTI